MKMYVLVRKDMHKNWYTVQACHAVAEYFLQYPFDEFDRKEIWDNGTMVVLGVENEQDLLFWKAKIEEEGFAVSIFQESHIHYSNTALATIGDQKLSNLLKDLKLL